MKTLSLHRTRREKRGFSLAELMVVIVILGLLATLVVPKVVGYLFKASSAVAKSDINTICQAIDNWAIQNAGKYPDSLEVLVTPDENGVPMISGNSVPKDPWGNEYVYEAGYGGEPYKVISYGKDGLPGGEGEDQDIDNVSMRER